MLATFALGTAVGDLTGLTMNLGFLSSGWLFLAAILVPLVAWRLGAGATLCFWTAYVLTRPLGASFADWIGKDHAIGGGLGFGDLRLVGAAGRRDRGAGHLGAPLRPRHPAADPGRPGPGRQGLARRRSREASAASAQASSASTSTS